MAAATQAQQRTAYKVKAMSVEALRMSWPAKYASTAEVNSTNVG